MSVVRRSAFFWLASHVVAGYARQHPLRTLVQIVAIAVGVALGYAVQLINASALNEFSSAVRAATGQADASISGAANGFDERVLQRVIEHPAVELASPRLTVSAAVLGTGAVTAPLLTIVGLDAFRAAALESTLLPQTAHDDVRWALLDDGVFLSPAALQKFKLNVGDVLNVQAADRVVGLTIAGTVPGAPASQLLGVMDLGFAQWRLDRVGTLTRIDVKLAPGSDPAAVARALDLPPGVALTGSGAEETRVSNLSRAYRINLSVLALVALFTGAFLVLSLQAQATVARRSQLAFLRVAGVTARQLQLLLIGEAIVLGAIGSALGLVFGALLATVGLQLLGGDLGSGFFAGVAPRVHFSIGSLVSLFALGMLAAIVGTWLPARDAARTPPALAMKAGAEESAYNPVGRTWPGVSMLALAALMVVLPPVNDIPMFGYAAIAGVLLGVIALQPRLARTVFESLARRLEHSGDRPIPATLLLAVTRVAQAPNFAAIGMAGIVASFSLMIAMATMVASFRDSVDDWLTRILPAQLYIRAAPAPATAFFSPADIQHIVSHPGVERADLSRAVKLQLDPQRAQVTLLVRPIDADNPAAMLPLTGPSRPVSKDAPPIWITEPMVDIYGMHVGQVVELPLAGRLRSFIVAGVWRDYARQFGAIAMRASDYQSMTGDQTVTDAGIWLKPGFSASRVIADLRRELEAPAVEFAETGEIRQLSLQIFDRSFAVTYVLEVAAIAIGLVGIAATFSSQAIARTREFGMLRHIGLTRRQILQVLAIEGALLTALAIAVGLVTGLVISVVLIKVINPQSFNWTMDFNPPRALIATLMLALMAAAVLTAVLAGRRAVSIDAVRAVSEDW
ncbi:MAG: FtsX-like permease family protein [Burkholderiaceae bacterium]